MAHLPIDSHALRASSILPPGLATVHLDSFQPCPWTYFLRFAGLFGAEYSSKELFAYLVDRRGSSVTTGEAYAALFEDAEDTLSGKSYFRTILHEMVNTLKKAGVEEILVKGRNSYAVIPEKIDCDYYRFLQGDPAAVNAFQNDYMAAYSWAEIRNAELGFKMK